MVFLGNDQRSFCHFWDCIRVFFQASCSWWSEGLFGQSFFVAPPVQALRGLPCLGSFFIFWHVRHIEGLLPGVLHCRSVHQSLKRTPWMGSYSVIQCSLSILWASLSYFMGQPLFFSCQCWRVRKERLWWWLHPHPWLSIIALLTWLLDVPPQAFPTTIFSLTSPLSVSLQSTAALALGLLHNP